jgi:hypothetical protein
MKKIIFLFLVGISSMAMAQSSKPSKDKNFFELKVYEYKTAQQQAVIDQFLADAYLPYLHKQGIEKVGVFTGIANDTAALKKLYVLIPYKRLADIPKITKAMFLDAAVAEKGSAYLNATSEAPAYDRIVNYFLEGFRLAPGLMLPKLKGDVADKVYELRSYEGASEKKYWKKVEMFNEGGEIDIFSRLNFNPVFYAEVISGPTMPNLMYMTSFESKADRDAHWQSFKDDAQWKALSAKKEYEKTVSKNVTLFLRATPYSDY